MLDSDVRPLDTCGNRVDRGMETVFTEDMTNTNHEPVEMPSAADLRKAAHIIDLTICAAEDNGLLDQRTIEQLTLAHDHLDHLAGYRSGTQ